MEAGSYNAAPGQLVQGAALMEEDLSPIMQNVGIEDSHIKIQTILDKRQARNTTYQFNRQLSFGRLGGSAQFEGAVGAERTSQFARITVPIAYYAAIRRNSDVANTVKTFDGITADDRAAKDEALNLASDIEFDIFNGQGGFSDNGMFTGNPLAVAVVPNMMGMDPQIRFSDAQSNAQDLVFASHGADQTVVLPANGTLTQSIVEDAAVRSAMNAGAANRFFLDPISLSQYNKIAHLKERITLAGSAAQESTGAHLRQQHTASGLVTFEASRFLSGKTRPYQASLNSPAAPAIVTADAGAAGSLLEQGTYVYYVTSSNINGESLPSVASSQAVAAAGNRVTVTITPVAGAAYYSVYRSKVGGSAAEAKLIGKIKQGSGSPVFSDLGNRSPGSVTGFLIQESTFQIGELKGFTKKTLAQHDLSTPDVYYRWLSLAALQPRKNVLVDNIPGQLN